MMREQLKELAGYEPNQIIKILDNRRDLLTDIIQLCEGPDIEVKMAVLVEQLYHSKEHLNGFKHLACICHLDGQERILYITASPNSGKNIAYVNVMDIHGLMPALESRDACGIIRLLTDGMVDDNLLLNWHWQVQEVPEKQYLHSHDVNLMSNSEEMLDDFQRETLKIERPAIIDEDKQ